MPIDPNIALGVRQPEPINMLGQMGQMMALRAAQQQYESENALRDFYAQGGDTSTPEGQRKLRSVAPKLAADILQKEMQTKNLQSEIANRDIGTVEKTLAASSRNLQGVTDANGYFNWIANNFKNPVLKSHFDSMGITLDDALARAKNEIATGGLRNAIDASSIGMKEFRMQLRQEEQGVRVANIGAAPGHRQASLAELKYADQRRQEQQVQSFLNDGMPQVPTTATAPVLNTGGGGGVSNTQAPASAPVNAMVQPQSAPAPVNALVAPPATQQQAPAKPASVFDQINALNKQAADLQRIGTPAALQAADARIKMISSLEKSSEYQSELTAAKKRAEEGVKQESQAQMDITANRKALANAGYNAETGEDKITDLIKKSTGSYLGKGTDILGATVGVSTKGSVALSQLETNANAITFGLLNGKLGAGISNDDRKFIAGLIGQLADGTIPVENRLAAWNNAKERMVQLGMIEAPTNPTTPTAKTPTARQNISSKGLPPGFVIDKKE